jgi:hypothetical protein
VRVLQPGGEADLTLKASGPERARQGGVEDLERDRAIVLEIAGEPDHGGAAAPELALEQVAPAQSAYELCVVTHEDPKVWGDPLQE